jgi:hypothetical protein
MSLDVHDIVLPTISEIQSTGCKSVCVTGFAALPAKTVVEFDIRKRTKTDRVVHDITLKDLTDRIVNLPKNM